MFQKLILLICGLTLCLSPFQSFAGSDPKGSPVVIKRTNNDKLRPHDEMPFVQEISCSIDGSVITIEFAEPEGTAKVFLYDLSLPSNILPLGYQISTTVPSMIPAPEKSGMYRLLITTSLGNEYEGYFDID